MNKTRWTDLAEKCQAEAKAVNDSLAAAGMGHVEWSGHHHKNGQIRAVDVHADEHEHDKVHAHFKKHHPHIETRTHRRQHS